MTISLQVPTPPPTMEVRVPNTKHRSRLTMTDPRSKTVTQQPPPPSRQGKGYPRIIPGVYISSTTS